MTETAQQESVFMNPTHTPRSQRKEFIPPPILWRAAHTNSNAFHFKMLFFFLESKMDESEVSFIPTFASMSFLKLAKLFFVERF